MNNAHRNKSIFITKKYIRYTRLGTRKPGINPFINHNYGFEAIHRNVSKRFGKITFIFLRTPKGRGKAGEHNKHRA